jgi:predicted phosphodiesterase
LKEFIIISDLHCGSKYAITTKKAGISNAQKAIKKIWQEMLDDLSTHTLTAGINLGDNTEGIDYHGGGKDNDSNDKLWQINMAKDLIEEIPVKKWHIVNGSGYHVGKNLSDDELLADKIGAEFGNELVIDTGLGRIHCAHKVGVSMSATAYRPTAIAREMMLATINQEEYGKFKAILRGHAHYYVSVRFGGSMGIICPCWKSRDSFAQERTLAMMPHLGYCVLKFDNNDIYLDQHIYTLKGKDLIKEVKV